MVFSFHVIFASEKKHRRSFFQGLNTTRHCEKNKYHLWGSILKSFHFGSDHQAEGFLDNFTLKQFKALDGLHIMSLSRTQMQYWVVQVFRRFSQIQTIKLEHTVACMTCHCQWWIASSPRKHPTHTPPQPNAQALSTAVLQKVWVFNYISSNEYSENLGRNKRNLRIFPGWFPYCFSSLHGIETTLDFYMIKEICGTNPRNLFLFPCLTPPGDRKDKMLHLHP